MAVSPSESRTAARLIAAGAAACICLAATLAQGAGPQQRQTEDVLFDGTGVDINYRTNSVSARDVVITQGDCMIQAGEAQGGSTGLKFDRSTWDFRGGVRIRCQGGTLSATQATVKFEKNRFASANVDGAPAEFEQRIEELDKPAHGHAGNIRYDFGSGDVHLAHDAWLSATLSDSGYEMKSDCIVYNLRERSAQNCGQANGQSGDAGRVHLRIRPGADKPEVVPPGERAGSAQPETGQAAPSVTAPGRAQ